MQHRCWLLAAVLLSACSSAPPENINHTTQAATFPNANDWSPLTRFGVPVADVANDGDTGGRELVGSAEFPAAYVHSDGIDFFVRMRLDADPSGAGGNIVGPYAWALGIELDRDLSAYDYLVILDGTPGENQIALAENTTPAGTGSTADPAETDLFVAPASAGVDGNVVISTADSTFNGNDDFFLDFSIPVSALRGAGFDFLDTPNFIIGTSDTPRAISVDLMTCNGNTEVCTVTTSHADGFNFDGNPANRDRDGVDNADDIDDDNDGILDTAENTLGADPDADADNDGIPNWRDADDEGDGSSTCVDANNSGLCDVPGPRYDEDRDGVSDHLDVDSDNDGIVDLFEAGHGATDNAGDGVVDGAVGANGFVDELETAPESGVPNYVNLDTDGDGVLNQHDLDSDGDGLFDIDEIGGTALDANNDGRVDSTVDAERDGLMATVDLNEAVFGVPGIDPTGFDPDGDSIPDPYDADEEGPAPGDSDGDGTDDTTECVDTWPLCADEGNDGFPDYMRPGSCSDNTLNPTEGCDDNDLNNGDGCNSDCLIEDENACNATDPGALGNDSCASGNCDLVGNDAPGVCEPLDECGNGILEADEGCDDGNTDAEDGCSAACRIEDTLPCNTTVPGSLGNDSCASGNCDLVGNDAPGVCEPLNDCGNGLFEANEACDDGNTDAEDGCSATCRIEDTLPCNATDPGLLGNDSCASGNCDLVGNNAPGVCEPLNECGNSILEVDEGCDDGNTDANDGCSVVCRIEDTNACNATAPGLEGNASCENGNCDLAGNDAPGVCEPLGECGNSLLEVDEGCDDGNTDNDDGCSTACLVEDDNACNATDPGFLGNDSCLSGNCDLIGNDAPGICEPLNECGNGIFEANEGCDDGNTDAGDGCSTACLVEDGNACNVDAPGLTDNASCEAQNCDLSGGAPGVCGNDTDGDGVIDFVDLDDDNDGIIDSDDGADGTVDTDGDGVPDSLDLDSDNDGAADVVEAGHTEADSTRDGQVDCPAGFGNNGFCDSLETTAESGIPDFDGDGTVDVPVDTDGDSLPDFQDLDTDNDGISDRLEVDSGCTDTTPANERCDGDDDDGDGIVNELDDAAGFGDDGYDLPPDSDNDGIGDFRELDADNDGLSDHVEGESECLDANTDRRCDGDDDDGDGMADDAGRASTPDTDADGLEDYRDIDSDDDGILDEVEGVIDTDGDGWPNVLDLDSDDDGIRDVVEGSSGCVDGDNDGRCDGPDADGDGRADDATNDVPPDTDSDGADDYVDLDTDNDGLTDVFEGGSGCADTTPNNAVCDGPDGDDDGLVDDSVGTPPDSDGDGVDDFRDLDSDDDGITDLDEGGSGCTDLNDNDVCDGPDTDGDGIADSIDDTVGHGDETPAVPTNQDDDDDPDALDPDSDNDGNPDTDDSDCLDAARDGVCDDEDSDGDGIVDDADGSDEFGTSVDTDGDGFDDDGDDIDDDNDGILDSEEGDGATDTDGDGVPDSLDLDSDNDSILDAFEAGHDLGTGSGIADCSGGVGTNGFCDALETSADSGTPNYEISDNDDDTVPDYRDLDTDGDTISDTLENKLASCTDSELPRSVCDGDDTDGDGVVDGVDETLGFGAGDLAAPVDIDSDGLQDFRDVDSDGDTINDIVEAVLDELDTDGDGDSDDGDSDGDGISDGADDFDGFGGGPPERDTDEDGTPDNRDLDSDDDGIVDTDEAGDDPGDPVDTDGDGDRDFQDPDSDNDSITDDTDNCRLDANEDQQDLDDDGVGSACEDEFEFGVQGGGCNSSNSGTSGALALLLAIALLALRRSRRLPIAVLAIVSMAWTSAASAQELKLETDYPVERFRLSSDPAGILDVEWAAVTGHKVINVGLWMGWSDDPLNLYQVSDTGRERAGSLVSSRMAGNLIGSVGFAEWLQLGLEVPLILYQGQDVGNFMDTGPAPQSFGMGDLRLVPKVGILRQKDHGFNLGVTIGLTLPTSSSDDYFGESTAFLPELLISRSFASGLRIAANVGMVNRKKLNVVDLVVDDELQGKVGVGYRFADSGGPPLELDLSYALATGLDDPLGAFNRNYSEVKMGGTYKIGNTLSLLSAVGLGVAEGFGTPDWRVLAGLRFHKDVGAPPEPAAAVAVDSDGDGILDEDDACPAKPENLNNFEDEDGCPDEIPDTDNDGFKDPDDDCPEEPEDVDGFEDTDGCPDPDNDKDSFMDVDDECPDVPGVEVMKGCPDPDRDGDRVVDRLDNCPDVPGDIDYQGCVKPQLVKITDSSIEILDIVYFRTNKAIIRSRSFPMLDNVAAVMNSHAEIGRFRIEGHTDSRATARYNKRLSQARAESVVKYLVEHGVDASRLEAMGYGEDVPIADNETKEGQAANRRVEFRIISEDGTAIESKNSGPTEDTMD